MILLERVLEPQDCARVREGLARAPFQDGRATAGAAARAVKRNLQAVSSDPEVAALERFVAQALDRHPVFSAAALPKRLSPLLFSRTVAGGGYGRHTDDALMGPPQARMRTDLAFTLFLAEPQTYGGGALIVETPLGAQSIKLAAGDAVLYAAGTIHEVEEVRDGERLACVGWVESHVRGAAEREVLFDLAQVRSRLAGEDALVLDKAMSNLRRLWAEVDVPPGPFAAAEQSPLSRGRRAGGGPAAQFPPHLEVKR